MLKRAHWALRATLRMWVWKSSPDYHRAINDHLPVDDWRKARAIREGTTVEVPWYLKG